MVLDKEVQTTSELNFPSDHYWHNAPIEWEYFWGKLENGDFFHFSEFFVRFGRSRTNFRHWSLNGKFGEEVDKWDGENISMTGFFKDRFTFHSPDFGLTLFPKSKPIQHRIKDSNYYSITNLEGDGYIFPDKKISATGWFDHHWFEYDSKVKEEWNWLAVRLDCGVNITCGDFEGFSYCDIECGGNLINSSFVLDGKHLLIEELGMDLWMKPLKDELIFKPTLGFNYSEQPFDVFSKSKKIGFGMREKTYKKEIKNE